MMFYANTQDIVIEVCSSKFDIRDDSKQKLKQKQEKITLKCWVKEYFF